MDTVKKVKAIITIVKGLPELHAVKPDSVYLEIEVHDYDVDGYTDGVEIDAAGDKFHRYKL